MPNDLTPREREVLVLLSKGLSNPQIGAVLGITRWTVASHLESAGNKIGAHNRIEQAVWFIEREVERLQAEVVGLRSEVRRLQMEKT